MEWTIIPESVAAVASAAAAGAAWKSALASRRTSQDALRALEISTRPRISVDDLTGGEPERLSVIIKNDAEWDAVNVDVDVYLGNGSKITERRERLQPLVTPTGHVTGSYWAIDCGDPNEAQGLRRVEVRYSDQRLIARRVFTEERVDVQPFIIRLDEEISGP